MPCPRPVPVPLWGGLTLSAFLQRVTNTARVDKEQGNKQGDKQGDKQEEQEESSRRQERHKEWSRSRKLHSCSHQGCDKVLMVTSQKMMILTPTTYHDAGVHQELPPEGAHAHPHWGETLPVQLARLRLEVQQVSCPLICLLSNLTFNWFQVRRAHQTF